MPTASQPVGFLSAGQRRGIPLLPEEPTPDELACAWTLSPADQEQVLACRGEGIRRRFALQLCVLRRFGRFLEGADRVPLAYVNHLARQLDLDPVLFADEAPSEPTENAQRERIRSYLGYRWFDAEVETRVEGWLAGHAVEGIERELFRRVEELLRDWKVVLPAPEALERLVTQAAARGREAVFEQLGPRIPLHLCRALDGLLEVEPDGRSRLFRVRAYPDDPRAKDMLECLEQSEKLAALDLQQIDLRGIAPQQIQRIHQLTDRLDAHELKRLPPSKRYALMACFLLETQKTLLDHLVSMNDKLLAGKLRESRNSFEKQVRECRRRFRKGLVTAREVLEVLVEGTGPRQDVVTGLYEDIGLEAMRTSLATCCEYQQLENSGTYQELVKRLPYLHRYMDRFYRLPIRAEVGSEPVLEALEYLRGLEEGRRVDLPENAPLNFMAGSLRRRVEREEGRLRRQHWELALALTVRDKLRSGDLFLPGSREHVSFSNLIYDEQRWEQERGHAYVELSLNEADRQLELLRQTLDQAAHQAAAGLGSNPFASVENGVLRLKRKDELEVTPQIAKLRSALHGRLAPVRIEDLLRQVDQWCGLSSCLQPLPGYQPRSAMPVAGLLAALIAHGTNLGVATMGQSADGISVDMLNTATDWYLREETIKAAQAVVVNYHHQRPLSSVWGDGTSSSSDGQRFAVRGRGLLGSFYPRYFGYYERAITLYTHTSDQHAVYATQAISCSLREAPYLLDGLLDNNTILRLRQHTSDTHGYTEHIFGLCYLLGYDFMPRIKDLKDQRIYKMRREDSYGCLDPLFHGTVDLDIIREQWDNLVRLAASLRDRTSPAHVVVQRLAAGSINDRLSRALTQLGRIAKTIHVLRYIHEEERRNWVQLLLNRGEFRHILAKHLFFAHHGIFRNADYEEIMNKASCLSLLCNAVLLWNTVKMEEHVASLRAAGHEVLDQNLARVSPLAHSHVIPSGTYFFDRPMVGGLHCV